jgi:hypothetical protein
MAVDSYVFGCEMSLPMMYHHGAALFGSMFVMYDESLRPLFARLVLVETSSIFLALRDGRNTKPIVDVLFALTFLCVRMPIILVITFSSTKIYDYAYIVQCMWFGFVLANVYWLTKVMKSVLRETKQYMRRVPITT